MKEMIVKEGFAFIYLNNQIYSQKSIHTSLHEYNDFVRSSITTLGNYHVLKIESKTQEYSVETLSNELLNHILNTEKISLGGIQ